MIDFFYNFFFLPTVYEMKVDYRQPHGQGEKGNV